MESVQSEGPAAQAFAVGGTAVVEFADAQEPLIGRIGHGGEVKRFRHRNHALRLVQRVFIDRIVAVEDGPLRAGQAAGQFKGDDL